MCRKNRFYGTYIITVVDFNGANIIAITYLQRKYYNDYLFYGVNTIKGHKQKVRIRLTE